MIDLTEHQRRILLAFKCGGRMHQNNQGKVDMPNGKTIKASRKAISKLINNRFLFVEPSCNYWIYGYKGWQDDYPEMLRFYD